MAAPFPEELDFRFEIPGRFPSDVKPVKGSALIVIINLLMV